MAVFTVFLFVILSLFVFADKLFNGKDADKRDFDSYLDNYGCFIVVGAIILTLMLGKACSH